MKRVKIRSVEDFEALPENEWVEVVGGMKVTWVEDTTVSVKGRKLVVPLPEVARKNFKRKKGEALRARIEGSDLIVERRRRQPRRT
jgi:hypothetical protein